MKTIIATLTALAAAQAQASFFDQVPISSSGPLSEFTVENNQTKKSSLITSTGVFSLYGELGGGAWESYILPDQLTLPFEFESHTIGTWDSGFQAGPVTLGQPFSIPLSVTGFGTSLLTLDDWTGTYEHNLQIDLTLSWNGENELFFHDATYAYTADLVSEVGVRPVFVPDGGSSALLLGFGLIGLCLMRRS